MRSETINIYTFEELSDQAKQKARQWWRETSDMDLDYLVGDDFESVAKILGITFRERRYETVGAGEASTPAIYWQGFSYQGDGASFEGRYKYVKGAPKAIRAYAPKDEVLHNIADRLQDLQRKAFYRLHAEMTVSGRGVHSGNMDVETWIVEGGYCRHPSDEVSADMRDLMREFADWMFRQLRDSYWANMEDEVVDDNIIANEYEFEADGQRTRY